MKFLVSLVIGIFAALGWRQACLETSLFTVVSFLHPFNKAICSVHPLLLTSWTPFLLLFPFVVMLMMAVLYHRVTLSRRWLAVALGGFSAGAGLAGLDSRPVDLPRHWTSYDSHTFWVYGQVQGLPKRTESTTGASAYHSPAHSPVQPLTYRATTTNLLQTQPQNAQFLFYARCWVLAEHRQRMLKTPDHFAQAHDQYRSTQFHRRRTLHRQKSCRSGSSHVPAYFNHLSVTVYHFQGILPEPGRWGWLLLRLRAPRAAINPGSGDPERWMFVNHLGARATWQHQRDASAEWENRSFHWDHVRNDLSQYLQQQFKAFPVAQRVVPALVVGDRRGLTNTDWKVLSRLGLGHLVAISGLHIGFMAALGYGLGWLGIRCIAVVFPHCLRWWPAPCWAWLCAWILAAGYSALAGFALPTVRALTTLTVLCVCRWCFSACALWRAWFLSAVVIVGCMPRSVFDVSFWLSFTAVGILLFLATCQYRSQGRFTQAWRVQWGLSFGLLPMNLAFFQQVSWASPWVNAVAIPLVSFAVVPLLFVALVLACLWEKAAAVVFQGVGHVLTVSWSGILFLAQSPWVSSSAILPKGFVGAALVGVVLLGVLPRAWQLRPLAVVLGLAVWWHRPEAALQPGEFRLTVLDVGQGSANLLETKNHVLIYDAGPGQGDSYLVDATWLPLLRYRHRDSIHVLISSHTDADHSGSLEPLMAAVLTSAHLGVEPPRLGLGDQRDDETFLKQKPFPEHRTCVAGQRWQWDGVDFHVLFPEQADLTEHRKRNLSCVLKVTGAGHRVLLTGDITRDMEAVLLKRYGREALVYRAETVNTAARASHPLAADLLFVPHHGSKTSSSTGLLYHVNPTYALVSHGYRNAFGHPHPEVKARYDRRGIQWLSTGELGGITVLSHHVLENDAWEIAVESTRRSRPALWRY